MLNYNLVGIDIIHSKKDNSKKFMKLSFVVSRDEDKNHIGYDVLSEITNFNDEYLEYINQNVRLIYIKTYNGMAVLSDVELIEKEDS